MITMSIREVFRTYIGLVKWVDDIVNNSSVNEILEYN
jgi:hypothetical protein